MLLCPGVPIKRSGSRRCGSLRGGIRLLAMPGDQPLQVRLLPIEAGAELFGAFARELAELSLEFFHRSSVRRDYLVYLVSFSESDQNGPEPVDPVLPDKELNDQ